MGIYCAKRLALAALIVLVAILALFSLLHLIPGDPVSIALGPRATPEIQARYAAKMHLDEPVVVQFLIFLGNPAARRPGDRRLLRAQRRRDSLRAAALHPDPGPGLAGLGGGAGHSPGLPLGSAAQRLARPLHRSVLGRHHRGALLPGLDLGHPGLRRRAALAAGHRGRRPRRPAGPLGPSDPAGLRRRPSAGWAIWPAWCGLPCWRSWARIISVPPGPSGCRPAK